MNSHQKENTYWPDVAQDKKVQTHIKLNLASWNIRTMLDRTYTERPERRSAIISKVLSNYQIDIAALSEVRFAESGCIREESGYTIYWSGKPSSERSESGVGLAINNNIIPKLCEDPKPVSDRIMTLRLPLTHKRYCTIISIYAPTMTNTPESIDGFYDQLSQTLRGIPFSDKIILMGDFNARVGDDFSTWKNVIGKHGSGKINANGERLLNFCSQFQLTITNTCFKHKPAHKNSWMHPRSKHWHLIDYIITRQRDLKDIHDTRAMRGADCNTDHIMIRSRTSLIIKKKMKKSRQPNKKLNVSKLKNADVLDDLKTSLNEKLRLRTPGTVEDTWKNFKTTVYETSKEKLGNVGRKHEDWFDEYSSELQDLLNERNLARSAVLNRSTRKTKGKYKECNRALQKKCRELKNTWWQDKAAELQELANRNDMKGFYESMRAVWGPRVNHPDQLIDSDNHTLLTQRDDLMKRWTEHFRTLLNETGNVEPDITNHIKQQPSQDWMNECPDIAEVVEAVNALSDRKSPGNDGIHPELLKKGGEELLQTLTEIITESWRNKEIPQDWKDAQLVTIFKKGDRRICGNYRGISLLSIPGKVFARILLNRLTKLAEQFLPEAQCGFRAGRGTSDMIFSLRQIQEKCIEQNMPLYMIFVDFTKAFDTVNRTTMWKVLRKLGCPDQFTTLISSLHTGMKASVNLKGELSEPFEITNGVKQGCVLAPTLFSIYLTMVMNNAFDGYDRGVWIQARPGADLFNINQFKSSTRTNKILIRELMFADDTAFVAHHHQDAQEIITRFAKSAKDFGLKINITKTEMMYQPPPGRHDEGEEISIDGEILNSVKSFKYLGSTITYNNKLDQELHLRMSKASQSFGRLREKVWDNKDLTTKTKCAVYQAIVLSTLLYGVESWTVYKIAAHKLNAFVMSQLRQILSVKWWHFISNMKILQKTNMSSLYDTLIQRNLRWAGHINRLDNNRIPKQVLYSQLVDGSRGIGRPRLRFKDTIKRNLKDKEISLGRWQKLSLDRPRWRQMIHQKS